MCVVAMPGAGLWAARGGSVLGAACMRAGIATSWRTARSGRTQATELVAGRTRSAGGLGWEAGILNGNSGKPKGIHWRTFESLHAAHEAHVSQSLVGLSRKLGLAVGIKNRIKM